MPLWGRGRSTKTAAQTPNISSSSDAGSYDSDSSSSTHSDLGWKHTKDPVRKSQGSLTRYVSKRKANPTTTTENYDIEQATAAESRDEEDEDLCPTSGSFNRFDTVNIGSWRQKAATRTVLFDLVGEIYRRHVAKSQFYGQVCAAITLVIAGLGLFIAGTSSVTTATAAGCMAIVIVTALLANYSEPSRFTLIGLCIIDVLAVAATIYLLYINGTLLYRGSNAFIADVKDFTSPGNVEYPSWVLEWDYKETKETVGNVYLMLMEEFSTKDSKKQKMSKLREAAQKWPKLGYLQHLPYGGVLRLYNNLTKAGLGCTFTKANDRTFREWPMACEECGLHNSGDAAVAKANMKMMKLPKFKQGQCEFFRMYTASVLLENTYFIVWLILLFAICLFCCLNVFLMYPFHFYHSVQAYRFLTLPDKKKSVSF